MELNWIAIVAAGVAAFVLGGLWYSPALFARSWQRAAGLSDEQVRQGNMALIFGGALVLSILAAAMFSMFLGPRPELGFAAGAGFSAGLFWVMGSLGIFYLFERRPLKLWLINGGYATAMFTLIGAVLSWLG
jgi:hypothetical protein